MDDSRKKEWLASRKQIRDFRSADHLFAALRSGNRTALSSAITLLESTLPTDEMEATKLIRLCLPYTGKSIRIGISCFSH
jgi:LAO/AO transport system kinase